jgi:riboflavin biosynthesis pyrimidine reductase
MQMLVSGDGDSDGASSEGSDLDLDSLALRSPTDVPGDRPWVMANMVTGLDGAYAVDERSAGLSGDGDRQLFHRLRAATDAVLVAAGTARAERYRRPRTPPELLERRRSAGLAPHPRLVLVSASLELPSDLPLLEGDDLPTPIVLHPSSSDASSLPAGVESRPAGGDDVDLRAALAGLRADGVEVLLCEGGPHLLGQLHALDLVDELFLSISAHLVGGERVGLLGGVDAIARPYELHRLLRDDQMLLGTYRRAR